MVLLWLGAALLAWLAVGPVGVLAALGSLAVPRIRRRVRPTWKAVGAGLAVLLMAAGVVVLLPDGRLPLPPGPGLLVTPRYEGRPAQARPVQMAVPQHPFLAGNGRSSMHGDGWATDTYPWAGPLGRSPEVDTAWFGVEECASLVFPRAGGMVGLCGGVSGPALHLFDETTMRKTQSLELPDRPSGRDRRPWEDLCSGAYFYLDERDQAVVATTDQRILVVATDSLAVVNEHDLSPGLPAEDCVVALMPDWHGRTWFFSEEGRTGFVETDGRVGEVLALDEEIANSVSVDEGGVYVVTDAALYRLGAQDGRPAVRWRAAYDRGDGRKPGQLSAGSGTTPTLLPGGLVAITDNAEPRMRVVVHRTRDGSPVCSVPVFDAGASATDNSLVAVGRGVVVENNYGYSSPLSTTFGQVTEPGFARVDVRDGECAVTWTSQETAPSSVAKLSLANGLLYAYTLRGGWWGVSAWYLTAIDVDTGERAFSVRTGQGLLFNNHYAAVTLAPDGSAYVGTLGGLVRVRDGSG